MYHVWHLSKVTTKRTNVCSLGIYLELQKNLSLPKGYTSSLKVVIDLEIYTHKMFEGIKRKYIYLYVYYCNTSLTTFYGCVRNVISLKLHFCARLRKQRNHFENYR